MPTVQLYDNNHAGLNADITFSAYTGGTYSLGLQTIPYVFVSDYPYGYYDLTYSQWNQVCSLFIVPPILFLKLDTTYGLGANFTINGDNPFDMTINWGDGNTTTYNGSNYYTPTYTYSTPNTEYNVTIEFNDNSIITYIVIAGGLCTSIDNLKILTNLNNLILENNKLTTLDLTNNSQLIYLLCASNQLTTLDLSNNPSINILDLQNNQLTTLNLTGFNNLNQLYLQNNQLSSTTINNVLIGLAGNSLNGGYAYLYNQTPAACPTSLGLSAAATLQSRSWSVTYDITCPPYFEFVIDTSYNNSFGVGVLANNIISLAVDWNDGSSIEYFNNDSTYNPTHYYGGSSIYNIKLYCSDWTLIYGLDTAFNGNYNVTDLIGINILPNLNYLSSGYNVIPVSNINNILIELSGTSLTGGYVDLSYQTPPACPTGDGIIAQNHLVNDLSWTVTVDTGCP